MKERDATMTMYDLLSEKKPNVFNEKGMLYHYTSIGTLEKFFADNGDFYCTDFRVLNDSSEMMVGMGMALKYLQSEFKWSEMKCAWFRENYKVLVGGGEIVTPWVMSFSAEKDSLNQWGMYTKRESGGVAVGFDVGQLANAIDRWPGCYSKDAIPQDGEKGNERKFELLLLPCLYAVTDEKVINGLFDVRLKPHADVFGRIGEASVAQEISSDDFTRAIISILEISAIIKHEAFRNEKEVRLVLLPMTKSLVDCELIGGKPRWKTYVAETRKEGYGNPKRKPLRGMIKEVIISPHGDTDMLWTTVRFLLDKYEMSWCALEKSTLPYNAR